MKISDTRRRDVERTINECRAGDVVELHDFEGVFIITDRFDIGTCVAVRLSDGFTFDVKDVSVARTVKYEFVLMD